MLLLSGGFYLLTRGSVCSGKNVLSDLCKGMAPHNIVEYIVVSFSIYKSKT